LTPVGSQQESPKSKVQSPKEKAVSGVWGLEKAGIRENRLRFEVQLELVIARSIEVVEGDAAIPRSLHHAIGVIRDDRVGFA